MPVGVFKRGGAPLLIILPLSPTGRGEGARGEVKKPFRTLKLTFEDYSSILG
jgi:hypothetical protein